MTMIKMVEPQEWQTFLNSFSRRNSGRRARFEIFGPNGGFKEEEQEGYFHNISIDSGTVSVERRYQKQGKEAVMADELKNIVGVSVQYDTDNSEDMLQFTDNKGGMTTLHFESRVDGSS